MAKPLPPIYVVQWADAESQPSGGWTKIKKTLKNPDRIVDNPSLSVGYLASKTKKTITLIAQLSHKKHWQKHQGSGDITIPRGMILKMKKLKGTI